MKIAPFFLEVIFSYLFTKPLPKQLIDQVLKITYFSYLNIKVRKLGGSKRNDSSLSVPYLTALLVTELLFCKLQ
ncbi:MAG TPA: hypothetical protein DF712_22765 [Balneola sp.]|nr:hypothetical protein [Bacteroidota bacterium]HCI72145.1 hypothetical protein [Balneola sp.]HCT55277.1 hypothetical protein [Balneola sp.]